MHGFPARSHRPAVLLSLLFALCFASTLRAQGPFLPENPIPQTGAQSSLTGIVKDASNAPIPEATLTLAPAHGPALTATTDASGRFFFPSAAAGPAQLTITSPGLRTGVLSVTLVPGESLALPDILLLVSAESSVDVVASREDLGRAEVALEEKQRVLGIFPNYLVTYIGNAVPLTTRQKFALAAHLEFDPVTLGLNGVVAGVEQATNTFPGYGSGPASYGKRLGANLADSVDSTFLGSAILPTLFRQDPRYFFRGPGYSRTNRALYAITRVVVARSDKGRWEPNYSNVLGNLAAAGISNIYYPASNRHGAMLTIDNALIGTASGGIGALIEEFVIRRITPNLPPYEPTPHP